MANTIDWYIIPVANPDGFVFSHESVNFDVDGVCTVEFLKAFNLSNFRLAFGEKLVNHGDHVSVPIRTETLTSFGCVS